MTIRYIVRDIDTQGCDFLMWGDDDEAAAQTTLQEALADGCDVELIAIDPRDMDEHTRRLIGDDPV